MLTGGIIFVLAALVGYLARELRQAHKYRKRWRSVLALLAELESENRDLAIGAGVFNEFDRMELRKRVAAAQEERAASAALARLDRDEKNYRKVMAMSAIRPKRGRHHWSEYR
jgi:hypothetical protein